MNLNLDAIQNMNGTDTRKLLDLMTPKLNKYMAHSPMPKQAVFMNLTCQEAFYGGAAGGGKSDCLLMDALQYITVPGYSAIIFRKNYSDLVKPGR